MTLSERNIFLETAIFFCAAVIIYIVVSSFSIIPFYQEMDEGIRRPAYLFQMISGLLSGNSFLAVHAILTLAALFSLITIIIIFFFFERTHSPEIPYIALFVISFSFEALRLILPLHLIYHFPNIYLIIVTRILYFARFFGIFSLFTAGVCAAGLEIQKTRNAIIVITVAALAITIRVPIDVLAWDTSLNMVNGFSSMFRIIELSVFITTMISFLVAAKNRGSREYIYIAVGVMISLAGRSILLGTDNWIGPVPGIVLLSFGTWLICSKLHKIYLWL